MADNCWSVLLFSMPAVLQPVDAALCHVGETSRALLDLHESLTIVSQVMSLVARWCHGANET